MECVLKYESDLGPVFVASAIDLPHHELMYRIRVRFEDHLDVQKDPHSPFTLRFLSGFSLAPEGAMMYAGMSSLLRWFVQLNTYTVFCRGSFKPYTAVTSPFQCYHTIRSIHIERLFSWADATVWPMS